jgi:hypothetical protein
MCIVDTKTMMSEQGRHECGTQLSGGDDSCETMPKRMLQYFSIGAAFIVVAFISLLNIVFTRSKGARLDGLEIQGTANFEKQVVAALTLLKTKSPGAYQIVTNHIGIIKQAKHTGMAAYSTPPTFELNGRTAFYSVTWCAAGIAHDSLHAKLYHDYLKQHPGNDLVPDDVWTGEAAERRCLRHQTRVLKDIGASVDEISWSRETTKRYWEVDYNKRDW